MSIIEFAVSKLAVFFSRAILVAENKRAFQPYSAYLV